jgi:DNA-binding GntR family transcriptional regulator
MNNNYAYILSRRLLKMIDESDTCEFPPFGEIAEKLNVCRATVSKAAHILKNEGILSGGKGQQFTIIRAKNIADKKPALSAVGKAAVKIREYINTPEAREQIRIPVMDLVKKLGYSHRTVCDALRLLVKERVVERYGRYYAIAQEQE